MRRPGGYWILVDGVKKFFDVHLYPAAEVLATANGFIGMAQRLMR